MDKRSPGSSFRAPAAHQWNNMHEAGQLYAETKRLGDEIGNLSPEAHTDKVRVRNDSCGDRRRGEVLGICDSLLPNRTPDSIWFSGAAPSSSTCYGVIRQPTPAGAVTDLQVSGVCLALVNVTNGTHKRAAASSGNVVLQSSSSGPIQLLHCPPGIGEKECVVVIEETCGQATGTTTTTTLAPCAGECKYTWSDATQSWTQVSSTCANGTTTSTTTTTTSAPTTTTTVNPCACSTTTTTSSTTTTPPPCECIPPTFCGVADGDCAYTGCSRSGQSFQTCGTTTTSTTTTTAVPTTTTTCNCNTTTANPSSGCTKGCDWIAFFGVWHQDGTSDCAPTCPCPSPLDYGIPAANCASYHTPCLSTTTTAIPPPTCTGECRWVYSPAGYWVKVDDTCLATGAISCSCPYPSATGSACEEQFTPCGTPTTTTTTSTTTTTTAGPCASCYTTTTSAPTTTTTNSCGTVCVRRWNGSSWDVESGYECGPSCGCPDNIPDGHETCEIKELPCESTTTTTTTTSTTTTTTTSTTTTTTTSSTTTTSTTTTTTSTTTTCPPCPVPPGENTCNYQCVDGVAVLVDDNCSGGTCQEPAADACDGDPNGQCDCINMPCNP